MEDESGQTLTHKSGLTADRMTAEPMPEEVPEQLLGDLRSMIVQVRERASQLVNTELVLLYWNVGQRIHRDLLQKKRAAYGEQVVSSLADSLHVEFGNGFSRRNLFQMIRFVEVFPNSQIVQTLSAQLSWSHFVQIITLEDALQRDFYLEMCRRERWSVRTLRSKIGSMLFERTAISRKPAELARQELAALRDEDRITPDLVFRDPYLLSFLGLVDTFSERDFESAIIRELERFLLELGSDFCFLARQKRMNIGEEDFYLDLLFYHRGLRRLVAIDLKLGRFTAAYKGQMELYLRWLDKYERRDGEESPIGLILCSEKDYEQIELLQLDHGEIRVAEYITALPSRAILESKLREANLAAHELIAQRQAENSSNSMPGSQQAGSTLSGPSASQ